MVDDMNPDSDEGDDWTKYADTGYTSTYDPWADMVPITESEEEGEESIAISAFWQY